MGRENPRIAIGTVLGNWTVLHFEKRMSDATRHSGYMCLCSCGAIRKVNGYTLRIGKSTSCGCVNQVNLVNIGTKPIYYAINYSLYRNYKKQAEVRGYDFELTLEEFKVMIALNCHYCDTPPGNKWKSGARAYHGIDTFLYNGIDRMDNSLGYTTGNTVPCCQKCNFAKKDFHYDDWLKWIQDVYLNLQRLGKFNDYPVMGVEHKSMVLEMENTRKGDDIV